MSSRRVVVLALSIALIFLLSWGASPEPRRGGADGTRRQAPSAAAGTAAPPDDREVDPQLLADHIVYTKLFRDLGLLPPGWQDGAPAAWGMRMSVDANRAPGWSAAGPVSLAAKPNAGACCRPKPDRFIECLHTTQDRCERNGGVYEGDGTTCASHPCPQPAHGACCLTSSTGENGCADSTTSACGNLGGAFQGVGSSCAAGSCASTPVGACCTPSTMGTPVCSLATSDQCAMAGGAYRGDGTVCAADTCAPPPTGACCAGTDFGMCLETTSEQCSTQQGIYLGDNFACVAGQCPPNQGLCCQPNPYPGGYSCVLLFSAHCEAGGGTFLGAAACSECDLIARGACCLGQGNCQMLYRDECLALGGGWHGAGFQCFVPLCG
jgi:hypothetical protein